MKQETSSTDDSEFSALPVLTAQVEIPTSKPTFTGFYRFATAYDLFLVFIGVFFAVVQGVALPMFTIVAGSLTNNFNGALVQNQSADSFRHDVNHNTLYFVYIGVGILVSGAISAGILANRGEVLASRFRKLYLAATLRQNIAYFDRLGSGEVTTRIVNSTTSIQEAISEKVGTIVGAIATFITSIVIAFVTQWKLSCILLSGVLFIILDMIVGTYFLIGKIKLADAAYAEGSSIVEESISAIRTSVAFGIQDQLAEHFDRYLTKSMKFSITKGFYYSFMLGTLWGAIFWIYALSFWEGSRILVDGETKIGDIFVVVSAMLIGAFQFGNIGPEAQYIVTGLAGLASVEETINRTPAIDSEAGGIKLDKVEGHIEFKNINFRYPSRPNVLVLPDFSLEVKPGQTVALVGSSGCGKSTCVGLLERFYKPVEGNIYLDGVDTSTLDVKWLRQQIGLVSQEPTLFAVSIYENIFYGLVGTEYEFAEEQVQREMIIDACKNANAWDFINQLDQGLQTNVGDRGFLLSGGQKQRIAIARAIVSDPKILLLDEATSALDTKSEGIVQDALEKAQNGRTTITIAHRLSTIRNSDKIVVMSKGTIIEQGTHSQLLNNKQTYYELVMAQNVRQDEDADTGDEDSEKPEKLVIQEDDPVELGRTDTILSEKSAKIPVSTKKAGLGEALKTLWRLNKGEQHWIIIGSLFAIALGYGYPAMSILVGESIAGMIVDPSEYPHMRSRLNLFTGMLFMIGVEQLITAAAMIVCLTIASENLVRKVRLSLFQQFLRMDMAYFDDDRNTAGSLTAMIAKEGKAIEGLGGATIGQVMQSLVILVGGIIQGIAYNWRVGLVATATVPLMLGSGFLRLDILNRLNERSHTVYEKSGSLAASYASAVRTVQALTLEKRLCDIYNDNIDKQVTSSAIPLAFSGLAFGLASALTPWVIALIFWYGSDQMIKQHVNVTSFFIVFIGCVMGSQAAGAIFNYAPNMGKAKEASQNVCRVLATSPIIDYKSNDGLKIDSQEVEGRIEFKDVYFRYPTRRQVPVLRGLNLSVKKGEFIALVGPSGCGKSTTIQLVEHFYNCDKGQVLFDGVDIKDMNVSNLRSHISLVQQEPLLYHGTVRENILYGWKNADTSEVTEEYLYDICRKANIHDFVLGLPDGYDTDIGAHGSLLSGGQKQRIAIARALIRNPHVLLLDEATSALDSQSEKIVQAALDEAAKGRTTIAVAHRLSTVQHADCIYVFERGRIVESGTHEELLKLKGSYAELVRLQDLDQ